MPIQFLYTFDTSRAAQPDASSDVDVPALRIESFGHHHRSRPREARLDDSTGESGVAERKEESKRQGRNARYLPRCVLARLLASSASFPTETDRERDFLLTVRAALVFTFALRREVWAKR